jgi:DNA-binding beta-propeller fold protein YncE
VSIGTDSSALPSRPFGVAFTPEGKRIVVTCFRSNTVSLIDVDDTLSGGGEAARLTLATPDGGPGRPRGIAITPDGRYAAVVGAAKAGPMSSMLWIIDLDAMNVVGLVTGVGNESYFLATLP